jgi:leader peptidase (prepilin peptidase) / N-methyltransferase
MSVDLAAAVGASVVGVAGVVAGLIAARLASAWARGRPVPPSPVVMPIAASAALGGVSWMAIVWRWGLAPSALPLLALAWVMLAAAQVDLRAHVIPDRLTLRASFVLAAALVGLALWDGADVDRTADLVTAGITAVVLPSGLLLTSSLFRRRRGQSGVGLGDVKLAIPIGLVLGWLGPGFVLLALLMTFASSTGLVLVLLGTRRLELGDRLPFGPHLAVGTVGALVGGGPAVARLIALLGG